MIASLLVMLAVMGILYLIGPFSPRSKRWAISLKNFILKIITGIFKNLPATGRRLIVGLIIGVLLLLCFFKQKIL